MKSFTTQDISSLTYYLSVRELTCKLVAPLSPEDMVVQPVADVSPPKWHLAHTTWFFEEFILKKSVPGYQEYDPNSNYLFNSYYESMGDRVCRTHRGALSRPGIDEILAYRKHVDQAMEALISLGLNEEVSRWVELGIHHEQQHQELLVTDIKYILGHHPLFPAYHTDASPSRSVKTPTRWLEVKEGLYHIGYDGEGFHFDNEEGIHQVFLHRFEIMDRPVNNGEWLGFIDEGGYQDFRHWLSEGWDWVKANQINSPEYWQKRGDNWYEYTMAGLQQVDPDAPVAHISYYEAEAFARWSKCRLPTEAEWESAARLFEPSVGKNGWLNPQVLHPSMTDENPRFSGSVWEWTGSAYLPYPFYKQEAGALGEYNGKWMVGQMVLRGGSCATPESHYRHTYRNFFQPEKRWQFTGLRLARHI